MYIAALDQGTTSTRCLVFDHAGNVVARDQREHRQIYPRPGWVEHDPAEIWERTQQVVAGALASGNINARDVGALGITNQRETTVLWDRATGQTFGNALVWQDTRTQERCDEMARARGGPDRFRARTGLPLSPYFSATKIRWILDNVPGAGDAAARGDVLFGTMDTFLAWRLTGGPRGGVHATDVTNASRTLLMNLATCDWDDTLLAAFAIPRALLPVIVSSSEVIGTCQSVLPGVPLAAMLGDQQAALVGQTCFNPGEAKNTYGTGCFLLLNTGEQAVFSERGLLTTVAYQLGASARPVYALEGSVAVAGALVQWLRDNLGLIESAAQIEALANTVADTGGCVIVPAFSGLFAPHWRPDARGVIAGLTGFVGKGHLARAVLEAVCYQTREVLEAMNGESGAPILGLKVDGGMTINNTFMQLQADIAGLPVTRAPVSETTALGAAYAAGLAVGFWRVDELGASEQAGRTWQPTWDEGRRAAGWRAWRKAVERTLHWAEP